MSIKVDVGTPPEGYKEWTTALVKFHGFVNLPTTRGEYVASPKISCFGHQWRLRLYPGGNNRSDEGYATISFVHGSNTSITIQHGYSVRDADGKEVVYMNRSQMSLVLLVHKLQGIMHGLPQTLPGDRHLWNY